jgi:hypothetical protein
VIRLCRGGRGYGSAGISPPAGVWQSRLEALSIGVGLLDRVSPVVVVVVWEAVHRVNRSSATTHQQNMVSECHPMECTASPNLLCF